MFYTQDEQLHQICCTLDEISNISLPPQATDSPHTFIPVKQYTCSLIFLNMLYSIHYTVRVTVKIHNFIDLNFDIIKYVAPFYCTYTSNKEYAVFVNLDDSGGNWFKLIIFLNGRVKDRGRAQCPLAYSPPSNSAPWTAWGHLIGQY